MLANQHTSQPPHCPDCASGDVFDAGRIPPANLFAGRLLPQLIEGGNLWRCRSCYLAFRWPALDKPELDALYAEGDKQSWSSSAAGRCDWHIAKRWLRQDFLKASTVLDVGCFDGGFLDYLGKDYERFGVELHPSARRRAEEKGITIVGEDFESFPKTSPSPDCVTAFDVIEHVHQPARFLARCRDILNPGGRILISTGNANAPSFRFMGAGYWYCSVAEHISFISPRWCQRISTLLGLTVEKQAKFSHGRQRQARFPIEILANAVYRMSPGLFSGLRRLGFGDKDVRTHQELAIHPPSWISAKDHFIVLFRKN